MPRVPKPLTKREALQLAMPFHSDGCTKWPDIQEWQECCCQHDRAYQFGKYWGMSRARADKELRDCVRRQGYWVAAQMMYIGVRLFGARYWDSAEPDGSDTADV